jgi:hypothetical protein
VAVERTNISNPSSAERYYTEHVRIFSDEGADNELLGADITEKLQRGWKLKSMIQTPGRDSVELVWDASGPSRESDAALIKTMPRATRRLLEAERATTLGAPSQVLKWVGAALLLVSCALLVYLSAVLVARLVLWAYLP